MFGWLKKPSEKAFKLKMGDYLKYGRNTSGIEPHEKIIDALNDNTQKVITMANAIRYESAIADWKSNIAIAVSVVALFLSMLVGAVTCYVAHRDSNETTKAIVQAVNALSDLKE